MAGRLSIDRLPESHRKPQSAILLAVTIFLLPAIEIAPYEPAAGRPPTRTERGNTRFMNFSLALFSYAAGMRKYEVYEPLAIPPRAGVGR
jgi:hypothetical protein